MTNKRHRQVVVGFDVGGGAIRFHARDCEGRPVINELFEYPSNVHLGPELAIASWIVSLKSFLAEKLHGRSIEDVVLICVSTPGPAPKGRLEKSANFPPSWVGTNLPAELCSLLKVCVTYENDGNVAGLAGALSLGDDAKYKIVAFLGVGTGLGGALVINQGIISGTRGATAEVGHVQINMDGLWPSEVEATCGSGCRKCAEAFASLAGLERNVLPLYERQGKLIGHPHLGSGSMKERARALRASAMLGDAVALEIFALQAKVLGRLARTLAVSYDPDFVLIGGGITHMVTPEFLDWFMGTIKAEFAAEKPFPIQLEGRPEQEISPIEFRFVSEGDLAGAAGASGVAYSNAIHLNQFA